MRGIGMIRVCGALAALLLGPVAVAAGNIDQQLAKLDPEERAHQVCVMKGIDIIRREGKLPRRLP